MSTVTESRRALAGRVAFALLVTLVFFLAIYFIRTFEEMERGVYSAFSASLLHDGDLNIVNRVAPDLRWLVTKSYNHPTNENHGTAIFWTPWCMLAEFLAWLWSGFPAKGFTAYEMISLLRNTFYLMTGIMFCRSAMREHSDGRALGAGPSLDMLLVMSLFASPLLVYVFFRPLSIEATNFFLSAVLCYVFVKLARRQSADPGVWLGTGALIGLATVLKVSFGAYLLPCLFLALALDQCLRVQICLPRRAMSVAAGFAGMLFLQTVNFTIQFGELTISSNFSALKLARAEEHFGMISFIGVPNGFLVASPLMLLIFVVAALSLPTALRRITRDPSQHPSDLSDLVFSMVIILHVASTYLTLDQIPTYPDNFSSRVFLNLLPPGLLLLSARYSPRSGNRALIRFVGAAALLACMAVNFIHTASFLRHGALYPGYPSVEDVAAFFSPGVVYPAMQKEALGILLAGCFSISLLLVSIWPVVKAYFDSLRWLKAVSASLSGLYLLVTLLNLLNNSNKVSRLRSENFFAGSVVSGGKVLDYYDEITSALEWGIEGFQAAKSARAREVYERYTLTAVRQAVIDPIGLRNSREAGTIRPSIDKIHPDIRWEPVSNTEPPDPWTR